jgi:hypothetical protein
MGFTLLDGIAAILSRLLLSDVVYFGNIGLVKVWVLCIVFFACKRISYFFYFRQRWLKLVIHFVHYMNNKFEPPLPKIKEIADSFTSEKYDA